MILRANSHFYEMGCDWVKDSEAYPKECAEAAWAVGELAWRHHPGRFSDGALENPILRLSQILPLPKVRTPVRTAVHQPRTLHVATRVYEVGGHTRVLAKWVARDASTTPSVVLTDHFGAYPEFLGVAVARAGGDIFQLPVSDTLLMRAAILRETAKQFDRVVLHTNPQDPIPVLAFGVGGGPPVALFNHAHFSFGFGATVSDLTINTMEYFRNVTRQFRFPQDTAVLPGTSGTVPFGSGHIDKAEAKRKLGFSDSEPLLMTIGAEPYFNPIDGYDFFQTATQILRKHPSLHLVVLGVSPSAKLVRGDPRDFDRIHLLGTVPNPEPYYRAADLCLESFPMPSLGGLAEAVIYGEAFPVPVYGPSECILRVSQAPVLVHRHRPKNEADYISYVSQLLSDARHSREMAHDMRLSIVELEATLEERFAELNNRIDKLKHTPRAIPQAAMSDDFDSRLLAQLSASHLDTAPNYLPYTRAVRSQLTALTRGVLSPQWVAREIGRRTWRQAKSTVTSLRIS